MSSETLEVAGKAALLYGTNYPASRMMVKSACDSRGWTKICVSEPSRAAALESACGAVAKPLMREANHPLTVRTLDRELAYEAVRIRRGHKANSTIHIFSAELLPTEQVQIIQADRSLDAERLRALVQREYESRKNHLSTGQMRTVIRNVVRRLKGVCLGGRGLYFLPAAASEEFDRFRNDALLSSYTLTTIGVAGNAETLSLVLDGLADEVDTVVVKLEEAASSGDVSRRSASHLRKLCDQMLRKISEYEAVVGQPLQYLAERVQRARQTAAVIDLLSVSV